MSKTKMEQYEYTKTEGSCQKCGAQITILGKFKGLPCEDYCCWCCSHKNTSLCPKEEEYGRPLDHFKNDTEKQILKALNRKHIFIGYMMLCRYLNNRGYIRYGCNAGYPEDDKSGNAKIDPCPILCPDANYSIGAIRYYVKKLASKNRIFIKTIKFYDSKNPYSHTAPKKMDIFTVICESKDLYIKYIQNHNLTRFLK
jgi:hypothetical protein